MTSFLTDYAKKNVEKLLDGALKELRYICCFTCIAKEFEEEKPWLEAERTTVAQRVKVAKRRGDDVQANAIFWEEEADKIIQEDTKTKQKCYFGLCPDCIWRYKRGKELANKKDQIKKLMEIGKELGIGLPAPLPDVDRYSSRHYISFKSRESKCKELLDALKDDNNYIVCLQGMGGTGKTTLAKEVGKKLKQSKQFTYIIDTTVSFSPNIKKIQDDIAGPLGLTFDGCSESDRPRKLWKGLTSGENILLILDDVWGDIDFKEIGIPYSDNHNGCRILVTTRNVLVCNKLECSKTIKLELLSQDDAWEMFKRHAGLTEISTKNLLDKGFQIANECQGLPIAIAVIASSLKGKHQVEWDVALKSLKKHAPIHEIDDDLVKIYECLKFSYDNMNDGKSKRLFLLCSVFPEDEEIHTERLISLGIGAGLFGENYGNYEDARSQVVISKNKLLDSCLLLEVDQDRVKMHDLVRDAAQWIAKKEIQTIKLCDKNQKTMVEREKNIKYLLCEGKLKDVLSCKLDSSKLQILIVKMQMDGGFHNEKPEAPNSFFENISGLRVFHLISDFYPATLSLPKSIQSLKNIRALLFNGVDLGDISILENLQSLETFELDRCTIDELPEGLAKLQNLILLKLKSCKIIRNNPFKVIEGCSSLEELYFISSFNDCCREISLPVLQRFILDDSWGIKNDSVSKSVSLEYPKDKHVLSEKLLKDCIQVVEVLRLTRIWWEWVTIIPEIVPMDHGMNDLVELQLKCISQLKCLIDTKHDNSQVTTVFSKLVVLKLEKMESLRELCNGPISFDSLKSLEKLAIVSCNQLQSLFTCSLNLFNLKSLFLIECPMLIFSLFELTTSRSLVSLEKLVIVDCRQLEYIIIDERKVKESRRKIVVVDDDDNNDRKRSQDLIFPKLKDLHIHTCHGLKSIFPLLSIQDLPALESISIINCEKLQYIFRHDSTNNFLKCDVTASSPISRDASKPKQESDPMKCSTFSWTNISCFGKKYWQKSITSARTEIPLVSEDQQQHIVIETGDHQSEFHQNHNEIHLQLPALESLYLENLPCLVAMCPKLYRTTFPLLKDLDVQDCLQFAIGDLTIHSVSQSLDSTIKKDLTKETTSFLVGPKNSSSLSHLFQIKILRCEKLEILFSTSILRCLPELFFLRIEECKELKHIIKDDLENEKSINFQSTNTYFPKLEILVVVNCNKLKCVFESSVCKELPKLKVLIIKEAYELQGIFKSEGDDQKLGIPNLEIVAFINLPNLCHAQGMHFQAVESRLVQNCRKLSLASASKFDDIYEIIEYVNNIGFDIYLELKMLLEPLVNVYKSHDTCNAKPSTEITHEFAVGVEAEASSESGSILTSSQPQVLMNEHSMEQQHSLGETDTAIKPQEDGDFQIAATSLSIATKETNDEVSLNDASKKVSSNIEEQFANDDQIIFFKSKPSPSISSPVAPQFPSIPSILKGDPFQKVEELSSSLPITKELEQLVLKKHLDYENLPLLTDFLVKHPSLVLKKTSLSNRYKGYAYNCLVELLKFLQSHSVLDVLGSNHSEFVELLQDVRKFGFDKEWLDGVERRVLFPDNKVSQDTLQKLLDSKQQAVSKEVEVLRLKIAILSQCTEDLKHQLTDLKHQLTSSEAVLESIIQQKTVLSAPIGY